ncbi:MAG TPA: PAS domain S-box protein, partial [Dehalococcoidia bacterium]|nr:PAS domain S-box protein [Dehalococcoidia bacterium]
KREIWVSATASKIEYEGRTATLTTLRDITADKAKDAALKAAEESKLRLIYAAAESIFVVQDWKVVYVNPAGAAAAGLPQKDMIGLPFRDFVHPDQREALTERYEKLLAGQWFSDFTTVKGIDAKGETRWEEIREIPYSWQGRPAVMSLAHDITDRMRADEERKEREERLRAVIENAWDGITILDENYNVIFESPSLARISGYTPEEWMGRPVGQMNIHPDDLAPLLAKIETLKSQPGSIITDVKIRYQHKDGSWRWIEATGRNLLHDPKVKGLVVNFRDITENVRADEERRASEERFRTLIEKATDVVIVLDATGKITYQSPSLERVTGFGHDEWVGRPLDQLLIHPDDLRSLSSLLQQVLTQPGATFEGITARYQHKDGSWHTLEATVANMLHDPKVNGLVANFRDITERKLAQEALRASEERNRLLVENASEVIAVIQDGLLKFINAKVTDFAGYLPEELVSRSFVELIHPDDRQMVADNYARRLRGEQLPNTYQFRVTHKNGDVRWAEISVALFEWEGQPATLALLNDITERKKAEEALREAKEYAENVIETANVLVVMLDTEGKVTLLNEAGEKITGYKRDEVLSKNWFELVVPKERYPNVWEEFSKIKAAGKIVGTFENPILTKSGEERIISWKNSTLVTGGKVVGTLSFGTDISERKNAEEALKESEAKYKRLFESTQTAMEVISMETGLVVLANEATARMFGFASPNDLVGEDSMKYLRPEDVGWVSTKMAQAVTDSTWQEIAELQVRTKDGRWLWISGMVVQSEYQGRPALLVSLLDITARKQIEEALRESEEKYRLLTEKTNDVIYTIDLDFNNTYVSPSVERILGFTPEEYLGRSPDQRMTLESLARAQEALLEHLSLEKDPKADPNRTVRIELEFYRKDGSTVWLEHQVSGLRDANGTAIGLHGVARDVTERRKAEQALRDSEAIYKRLFENTQTAMEVVSGETGLVVLANETTARMFGFDSAEDLVGVDSMEYLLPEDRDRVAAEMAQAIANKDHSGATELSVRTKDGRLLWINALVTYTEYAGKTSLLISLIDLTSRKRAEEKLKASEEKYRLIAEKTNDVIWTSDLNLRTTYVSPSVERVLGFTPEERLSQDATQQMTPES